MKRSILISAAITLFAFIITTGTANAQVGGTASAQVEATGNVLEVLSFTNSTNLDLGDIFPGVEKTIAPSDPGAAAFTINGEAGQSVDVTFTTPANLTNEGGDQLEVTNTSAAHNTAEGAGSATDVTDLAAGLSTPLESASGDLYLWVGATVAPSADQAAGSYSGDLTLDVAYTAQ